MLLRFVVDTREAVNAVNARFITVVVAPAHDPTSVSDVVAVPLVVLNSVSPLVINDNVAMNVGAKQDSLYDPQKMP